jgi:hypothetical protein
VLTKPKAQTMPHQVLGAHKTMTVHLEDSEGGTQDMKEVMRAHKITGARRTWGSNPSSSTCCATLGKPGNLSGLWFFSFLT